MGSLAFFVSLFLYSNFAAAQVAFLSCPEGTKLISTFENNEIHEWCADSEGVRNGGYSLRSADGTPKVFVEYKDDKRHGQYVRYHPNGKPAEQGQIDNDVPVGEWRRFYSSGALADRGEWQDGAPHGEWRLYHPTQKLKAVGNFDDGDRVGIWKFYDEEGNFKSEKDYNYTGLLVEAGYLAALDSQGHSHAGVVGVNWFPFQSKSLDGFSLAFRVGAIRSADEGPGGSNENTELYIVNLAHYWEFGRLLLGLQLGGVETGNGDGPDGPETFSFVGVDTYITVDQKWVKRYGFNLAMLENDLMVLTAKAVLWEF